MMKAIFLLAVLFIASDALAHSGGTDKCGGHYNRKTGTYHVHNWAKYKACNPPKSEKKNEKSNKEISGENREVKANDLFHITGCENGILQLPIINMWSKPGGIIAGARVVGKLSGDGRKDQGLKCQGSVVRALEIKQVRGRTFLKIKSVVNSKIGWITDSFVGKGFKKAKCKTFFSNSQHIANCLSK